MVLYNKEVLRRNHMKPRKVGIVGMGELGTELALALVVDSQVDELVLVEAEQEQLATIENKMSYLPRRRQVFIGTFADLADAELVLISLDQELSGITKEDVKASEKKLNEIISPLKASGFHGLLINLTEPSDVMTMYLQKELGYPQSKVMSLGGLFPSARLRWELSQQLGVHQSNISAYCLGGQGFSLMIPWSHVTIAGQSLAAFLALNPTAAFDQKELLEKIKQSTYVNGIYASGDSSQIIPAVLELLQVIFENQQKVLPASVGLNGELGEGVVYCAVPAIIGAQGVTGILAWELPLEEKIAFQYSCEHIRAGYAELQSGLNLEKLKP